MLTKYYYIGYDCPYCKIKSRWNVRDEFYNSNSRQYRAYCTQYIIVINTLYDIILHCVVLYMVVLSKRLNTR